MVGMLKVRQTDRPAWHSLYITSNSHGPSQQKESHQTLGIALEGSMGPLVYQLGNANYRLIKEDKQH